MKCASMVESMPEGKPPQLLIADRDEGQVMVLLPVTCLEDLLFKHYKASSQGQITLEAKDACKPEKRGRTLKATGAPGTAAAVSTSATTWRTILSLGLA